MQILILRTALIPNYTLVHTRLLLTLHLHLAMIQPTERPS